jgi:hypothetical protein
MRPHNRPVDHQVFQVWVAGKIRQHRFPNPIVTPARKAFVHTVPLPVFGGQQAPLRAAATYPQDRLNEAAALPGRANINASLALQRFQVGVDFHPLSVTQSQGFHEANYASFINIT